MKKQILYGMLGFLSLLGFAGVFTEARGFLGFFAFAVDFQYFFLKSDEMLEEQLGRKIGLQIQQESAQEELYQEDTIDIID